MRLHDLFRESDVFEAIPTSVGMSSTSAPPAPSSASPQTSPQTAPQQSGLAGGQMDPAQAAQAAKDRMEQKKQLQDQLKQLEQQLVDTRKRLAELG